MFEFRIPFRQPLRAVRVVELPRVPPAAAGGTAAGGAGAGHVAGSVGAGSVSAGSVGAGSVGAGSVGAGSVSAGGSGGGSPTTGGAAGDIDIRDLLEHLAAALGEIETRRQQSLSELQHVAVELAVAIASSVVHRMIENEDFDIQRLVELALEQVDSGLSVLIRLHPADLALLNQKLEGQPPPWPAEVDVRFAADASLERGSCRTEAGDLGLLSTVEQRLGDIRQSLLENLDRAETERRQPDPSGRNLQRFPDRRETA